MATGFSLLLQHGANFNARHRLTGKTCLHELLFFVGRNGSPSDKIQFLNACQYLVRNGADVYAVDYSRISVSKAAYDPRWKRVVGSFGGDIWDRVLAGAGYDVASFRTRHNIPRRDSYTADYKRSDFEAMWAGMTELCPYCHDLEPPYDKVYHFTKVLARPPMALSPVGRGCHGETWEETGMSLFGHQLLRIFHLFPPTLVSLMTSSCTNSSPKLFISLCILLERETGGI